MKKLTALLILALGSIGVAWAQSLGKVGALTVPVATAEQADFVERAMAKFLSTARVDIGTNGHDGKVVVPVSAKISAESSAEILAVFFLWHRHTSPEYRSRRASTN